jgi:hypothetical protein
MEYHQAISTDKIVGTSVRKGYNLQRRRPNYNNTDTIAAKCLYLEQDEKWITLPALHSNFTHDDRLLMNHVQKSTLPPNCLISHWWWIAANPIGLDLLFIVSITVTDYWEFGVSMLAHAIPTAFRRVARCTMLCPHSTRRNSLHSLFLFSPLIFYLYLIIHLIQNINLNI